MANPQINLKGHTMAKANAVRKQDAVPANALEQPSTVKQAPQAQPSASVQYLVYDGPQQVNASAAPKIGQRDVLQAGMALKNLAFNLLAGNVDPALFDKDAACWSARSIKDHKTAFFRLIAQKPEAIRDAWQKECEARKAKPNGRISQVSLQALGKLFKPERAAGTAESPYQRIKSRLEKLQHDVLEVIGAHGLSKDAKLRKIKELCTPEEAEGEKA